MSTIRANNLKNRLGTGSPSITGAAKAWVNFNGAGTVAIRESFNVSSITDSGTGLYGVNFTNALANANYATLVTTKSTTTAGVVAEAPNASPAPATSSFSLTTFRPNTLAAADAEYVSVAVFL